MLKSRTSSTAKERPATAGRAMAARVKTRLRLNVELTPLLRLGALGAFSGLATMHTLPYSDGFILDRTKVPGGKEPSKHAARATPMGKDARSSDSKGNSSKQ